MPSEPIAPGKWFADDLRRVRESLGLSRDDLVAKLKIDPTILDAFEATGLVGHPRYNRVYLTSFVRGVGEALALPAEAVAEALEQVFRGTYRGAIGIRFLGDPEFSGQVADEVVPTPSASPETEDSAYRGPVEMATDARGPQGIVVRRPGRWLLATALLVVAVAAAAIGIPRLLRRGEATVAPPIPAPVQAPEASFAPRYVIGDTMHLFVVALDTLNPVRVKIDDRLRAPYWIETGDSLGFRVLDRILIERRADRIALSIGGRRIPLVDADSEGTVRLSRARAQEILDSLRTAS